MAVILLGIRWRRVLTYAVFVVLLVIGLIYRYSTTTPTELQLVSDVAHMSPTRTENVNNSVDTYRSVPDIHRGQEQPQKVDVESRPNISYTELRDLLTPPINLSHQIPNQLITQNETNRPMQVIIVTKMRSGSSFTGELFNRNNDFVYYFEPLNEIKLDRQDRTASFMGVSLESILNNIVKCNFSNFKTFNWWNGRRPRQQCAYSNAYQAPPLCTSQIQRGKKVYLASKSVTDALKVAMNEATCRSRQHIAIKTVRISDIGLLKGLLTDPSLNVKIVHLVRDPRATSSSRQDIGDPDSPEVECTKMKNNLNYWLNPPDWIRGRYMLLRYEDLAERPHYIVDAVYDFLNLTAPSTIGEWLDLNTKIDDTHKDKWSHTRQSDKTAHAWRTHSHIKFDKIQTVQHECANVMHLLGYKSVHSSAELRDPRVSTLDRYTYPLLPTRTGLIGYM